MPLTTQHRMYIEQRVANEGKSTLLAYVLFIFLGGIGVHRFYLGKTSSGLVQLFLFVLGWALAFAVVGIPLLAILVIWLIIDIFLIPGMASDFRQNLRRDLENLAAEEPSDRRAALDAVDTSKWSERDRAEHQRQQRLAGPARDEPLMETPSSPQPYGWRTVNGERKTFTAAQFEASLEALRKQLTAWEVSLRRLERTADAAARGAVPGTAAADEAITLLGSIDEGAAKYAAFVRTLSFATDDAYNAAVGFEGEYDVLSRRVEAVIAALTPAGP